MPIEDDATRADGPSVIVPSGDVSSWPHDTLAALTGIRLGDIPDWIDSAARQRARVAAAGPRATMAVTDMEDIATSHWAAASQCPDVDYRDRRALQWRQDEAYPVARLMPCMTTEEWQTWFIRECSDSIDESRHGYIDLLLEDIEEEIVIVELSDGRIDLWDGWHRVAAAIVKGAPSIPAIVGRRPLTETGTTKPTPIRGVG